MTAQDLTAPVIVRDLAAKVALLEQYQPDDTWAITTRPLMGGAWVLQWHRLALTVGERSDLELARYIVATRLELRQQLRRDVMRVVDELGLEHPRRFRQPARTVVNAGLTKCPGCACNVVARSHRPGSEECRADREERLISIRS